MCPTSKHHTSSDLVNKEATTPAYILPPKTHNLIKNHTITAQTLSGCDISVRIYGVRNKIGQTLLCPFFTCGECVKHNIYSNKPCTEDHLKESIQNNKLCYYGAFLST